jgi:actin-related protein
MFEKYEVPALYVCKSSVLAGFSAGRSTCLVLDSGENTTYAVPVHEGYALQNCIMKYEIGGSYMDAQIEKYLDSQKIGLTPKYAFKKKIFDDRTEISPIEYKDIDPSYEKFCKANLLRDIKESMLRTSDQPATEGVAIETKLMKYEMPDGQIIEMGTERMGKIECLFKEAPEIPGFMGIHRMVVDAISKTDLDIRKDLYLSIVVCGGNTLLDGFLDKLQKYLNEIAPQNVRVKLVAHSGSDRKFSSWIGGSILTSLGSFQQMWVSKQEFHEHGDVIIERKSA